MVSLSAASSPSASSPTSALVQPSVEKSKDLESGTIPSTNDETSDGDQISPPETFKDKENAINAEDHAEPNLEVWWDEPADQDPANPMNWPDSRKWAFITVLSSITLLTPLASSMFAPGVPQVMTDFHSTSTALATFVISVFILGFAFGPLLLAPLSEMYGRIPIYHTCNILFLAFTLACATAKSLGSLITYRFLAGVVGVASITCGSGTIADIMPAEKRATAMALYSLGPLLGPVIGPISGGFLIQAKGWRWVFWLIAILTGIVTAAAFYVFRETYPVVLLERKAARLRKETGNPGYRSRLDLGLTHRELWARSIVRPMKLLFLSPIVSAMCTYIAVLYGLLYILFTTFTYVFEEVYKFSTSTAGLAFLGSGVGTLSGLLITATISDRIIKSKRASGTTIKPEDRLPLFVIFPASLLIPGGFLIYGWSTDKAIHWIVPQIGTAIIGIGMMSIMMCIQTYLVDTFTIYAASAIAANAVLRSLLGALFPLFGLKMYVRLGLGWGNTTLGLIALVLAPIPWLFSIYGERIRTNPKWKVKI